MWHMKCEVDTRYGENKDLLVYYQGAKEYVILNDFHYINIYLTINMKRSAKEN